VIKNHLEDVSSRDLDEEFINKYEAGSEGDYDLDG
jgi:hypothetical protein